MLKLKSKITTSSLAKRLFEIKNDYELRKKDSYIRSWLKKWEKAGIVKHLDDNGKRVYFLDLTKIGIVKNGVKIKTKGGSVEIKRLLGLNINDRWYLIEVE